MRETLSPTEMILILAHVKDFLLDHPSLDLLSCTEIDMRCVSYVRFSNKDIELSDSLVIKS